MIIIGKQEQNLILLVEAVNAEAEQNFLGIIIDKDLNFQNHTKSILKTANQKLCTLIRIAPLITDFNKKVIFNSFIKRQLHYCV